MAQVAPATWVYRKHIHNTPLISYIAGHQLGWITHFTCKRGFSTEQQSQSSEQTTGSGICFRETQIAQQTGAPRKLSQTADNVDAEGFDRFVIVEMATVGDLVGLQAIQGAIDGADPYTLEQWSDGYRVFQAVSGVATLVETAFAISMTASRFMTPCGSPHWGSCFVGDTQVLTREIEDATTTAAVQADETQSSGLDWITPVCILIGVVGTVVMQRKTKRRLNAARAPRTALDKLFSTDDLESTLTQQKRRQPTHYLERHGGLHDVLVKVTESKPIKVSNSALVNSQAASVNHHLRIRKPVMHTEDLPADGADGIVEKTAWRPASWVWLLLWLALGLSAFIQSSSARWSVPTLAKETAVQPAALKRFESRPIQDIRTGMRVIADNPELNGQEAVESHITPETWRNIHLRIEKPDGGELRITLLRSLDWLQARHAKVGGDIDVELKEMGVAGPATILKIAPCPSIESGPGRIVTGTFRHSAANVIDLYVTGENRPIGTTTNHPFWSETRLEFVQAGKLQLGEQLRTITGKTARVVKVIQRFDSQPVFNMEVDCEHVYSIASSGVIVHNSQNYDLDPLKSGIASPYSFKNGVTLGPESESLINSLKNKMNYKGWKGEPIVVHFLPDGTMEILDGHHRVAAAKIAVRKRIEVPWREATPEEREMYLKFRQQ